MSLPATGRFAPRAITRSPEKVRWLVAVGVLAGVWLFIYWAFRGQPGDDPYITYRYASNLASGHGFVFNPGERVQSTTTPLFTLLLALFGVIGLDIPSTGYLLSMLCLLGFSLFCVRLVSHYTTPWLGLAAVALTFACPVTTYGLGGEMPLLLAFAWGAWWSAASNRLYLAAFLAGLTAVTRGDGGLVAASIAVVYIITNLRTPLNRWPWGPGLLFVVVAAPWYIFAWAYFGSPLPATLGAKLAQGSTPGTTLFFDGLWQFWLRSFDNIALLAIPAALLLAIGLAYLAGSRNWLLAPVLWAVLFAVGFSLLHVPRYPWYYSPLVPVAMLAIVVGGMVVARYSARKYGEAPSSGAAVVCLVALLIFLVTDVQSSRPQPGSRSQLYITVGSWIAANTPPSASLGAEEVGLLGYYSDRRIIDFVGLIQPEVAPYRARGDNLWAVQTYHPDYILALDPWLASVGASPAVQGEYETLRTFDGPSGEHATLLKRTP